MIENNISSLKKISTYSLSELEEFFLYSPVSKIYYQIYKNPTTPTIYQLRHQGWLETALASYFNISTQALRSAHWSKCMEKCVKDMFYSFFKPDDPVLVLGLGKFGSEVLNLSSDIDIIIISDRPSDPDLIKKTRSFLNALNLKTEFGFLTRTDLNLKPSIINGNLVGTTSLTNYLWNSKELWERLVYTRAKKICGFLSDESSLFLEINKYCFRKYIRFDLIQDLSSLIQKILSVNTEPNNLKLAPGGIRSIELLISALQLLYAGRIHSLQIANTFECLNTLLKSNLFNKSYIEKLIDIYSELRRQEDLIQAVLDEQTHIVKNLSTNSQRPFVSTSVKNSTDIQKLLHESLDLIQKFLRKVVPETSPQGDIFEKLNYLKTEHPHIIDFIKFLEKNKSYVSLFMSHPKVYDNLLLPLIHSPHVTQLFLLRPDLLDLFLLKKENILIQSNDEDFLLSLSDFKSISQITAIGEFLDHFDIHKFVQKNSQTADFCVSKLCERVFDSRNVEILKLGKWAADELGVFSDLDFVMMTDQHTELSKSARKFINYLTHSTYNGSFYSIDLRLRPSGQAGPLMTSTENLKTYLENQASIWQKQAYLRNKQLSDSVGVKFRIQKPTSEEQNELVDIRTKRFLKNDSKFISIKESLGGLVDLEFMVQILFIDKNITPKKLNFKNLVEELYELNYVSDNDMKVMISNYYCLRTLEQLCEIIFRSCDLNEQMFNDLKKMDFWSKTNIPLHELDNLRNLLVENQKLIEKYHPYLNN